MKHLQVRLSQESYDRLSEMARRKSGGAKPNLQAYCTQIIEDHLASEQVNPVTGLAPVQERLLEALRRVLASKNTILIEMASSAIEKADSLLKRSQKAVGE